MTRENEGWTIRRRGAKLEPRTFRSKAKAVAAAKALARDTQPSQVLVEDDEGRISECRTYGLPKIQQPPYQSRIDSARIEQAVLKVSGLAKD